MSGGQLAARVYVVGIGVGLLIFSIGAAMLNIVALAGMAVAAASGFGVTWRILGRRATIAGSVAGVVSALSVWVAMRSMMRLVAVTSGITPILTLEGTSAILGTSIVLGLLPAMGYMHFRRRFGAAVWKALGYGFALSILGGIPFVLLLSGEIGMLARIPLIPVAFLLAVPILFGLVMEASLRAMKVSPGPARSP